MMISSRRHLGTSHAKSQPKLKAKHVVRFLTCGVLLGLARFYVSFLRSFVSDHPNHRFLSASVLSELPEESTTKSRRLGVLVGIFTADFPNDQTYRSRHRRLMTLWNDRRVCSLHQFQFSLKRRNCELVYTFVIGANPNATTEWTATDAAEPERPILVPDGFDSHFVAHDLMKNDVTRLNIRENMNEGKSQTWFQYASQIMQQYPELSYTMKLDADSVLHLHDFFLFAYQHLPPPPYAGHSFVGALRDKAYWPKVHYIDENERGLVEGYFGTEYEGVHLYLAGQCYILSRNLVQTVVQEANAIHRQLLRANNNNNNNNHQSTKKGKNKKKKKFSNTTYLEQIEDHDISAMVLHSPQPVHIIAIQKSQRFWEHPVKGEPRWNRIWHREVARMEGRPVEGKLYSTESSWEYAMMEHNQNNLMES